MTRAVITFAKYYKPETLIFSYDEGLGTYLSKMETYTNQFEKAWIRFRFGDIANMITDKVLMVYNKT